ncbi:MAG: hypothetical protein HOO97_09345 [Sideroxydans sp.]|nr:hypothetical protein [Sideroxydans sp.]
MIIKKQFTDAKRQQVAAKRAVNKLNKVARQSYRRKISGEIKSLIGEQVSHVTVQLVLDGFVEVLAKYMLRGEIFRLPALGTMRISATGGGMVRNPRTLVSQVRPPMRTIHFRPSIKLKRVIG